MRASSLFSRHGTSWASVCFCIFQSIALLSPISLATSWSLWCAGLDYWGCVRVSRGLMDCQSYRLPHHHFSVSYLPSNGSRQTVGRELVLKYMEWAAAGRSSDLNPNPRLPWFVQYMPKLPFCLVMTTAQVLYVKNRHNYCACCRCPHWWLYNSAVVRQILGNMLLFASNVLRTHGATCRLARPCRFWVQEGIMKWRLLCL